MKITNKYMRLGIIGGVGLLFATTSLILVNRYIHDQVHTEQIIVVKEDIKPFEAITKDKVTYQEVTIGNIPSDAVKDQTEVNFADLYATEYGYVKGSPLRKSYTSTEALSKMGSAVGLAKGKLEIGVKTDLTQSAGDEVKPGMHVDAYAWLKASDSKTGQVINPQTDKNLAHLLVKKVVNSQGKTERTDNNNVPAVIVLEVTAEQAKSLVKYQEIGTIYLLPSGNK